MRNVDHNMLIYTVSITIDAAAMRCSCSIDVIFACKEFVALTLATVL